MRKEAKVSPLKVMGEQQTNSTRSRIKVNQNFSSFYRFAVRTWEGATESNRMRMGRSERGNDGRDICCERFVFYDHVLCAHKKYERMPVRPVCLLHFGLAFSITFAFSHFPLSRSRLSCASQLVIYIQAAWVRMTLSTKSSATSDARVASVKRKLLSYLKWKQHVFFSFARSQHVKRQSCTFPPLFSARKYN